MVIKIITGHYYNLTYIIDEFVSFDNNLKSSDFVVIAKLEHDISQPLIYFSYDEEKTLKKLINNIGNISGKYIGKSRVDKSPLFTIDLKAEYRDITINEILKT